ncbi:uncharacterized protein AB9W97_008563 isoform 1-T1 [Spinachia spinachia]
MFHRLLGAIGCLCLLHPGLWAEECSQDVLAERETLFVPAGDSLSLSCVVQHCGGAWTGNWTRGNSKDNNITARHRLTNVSLSATQTRLTLNFPSVCLFDEGSYGCSVKWARGDTQEGHLKYVNVTAEECPAQGFGLRRRFPLSSHRSVSGALSEVRGQAPAASQDSFRSGSTAPTSTPHTPETKHFLSQSRARVQPEERGGVCRYFPACTGSTGSGQGAQPAHRLLRPHVFLTAFEAGRT